MKTLSQISYELCGQLITAVHVLHVKWHKIVLVLNLHLLMHNSGTIKKSKIIQWLKIKSNSQGW